MKELTFQDLYNEETNKPTPRQAFLREVSELTDTPEKTVQAWAFGKQIPHRFKRDEVIKKIAEHYHCNPDKLFPNNSNED